MSRTSNPSDNAVIENLFSTLHFELLTHTRFENQDDAQQSITEWIDNFYDSHRRHTTIGITLPDHLRIGLPSAQVEEMMNRSTKVEQVHHHTCPTMMPDRRSTAITIIIVNWNSGQFLAECLASIVAHGDEFVGSVVVVDNASTDDSLEQCSSIPLPRLSIVRNTSNLGFARACNVGAVGASTPHLLFLNPDARLLPDTLRSLLEFLKLPEQQGVGIAGVQLVNSAGHVSRCCARFPRPGQLVARALGLDRVKVVSGHFMSEWNHLTTRPVDHVIGAFFVVRRSLFEELGGFDERFFVYLEDLDFSLRAKHAGWESVYFAEANAIHFGGGSSQQVKAQRLFYSLRSRLLYSHKHFHPVGHMLCMLSCVLIEPISRLVRSVLRCSIVETGETLRGFLLLWRWTASNWDSLYGPAERSLRGRDCPRSTEPDHRGSGPE